MEDQDGVIDNPEESSTMSASQSQRAEQPSCSSKIPTTVGPSLQFLCDICGSQFVSLTDALKCHLKNHTEVEKSSTYSVLCNLSDKESNRLKSHLVTQYIDKLALANDKLLQNPNSSSPLERNKPQRAKTSKAIHLQFQCPHCPTKCQSRSKLNQHLSAQHQHEKQTHQKCQPTVALKSSNLFKCDHCDLSYKTEYILKQHVVKLHKVETQKEKKKKMLNCLFCSYKAKYPSYLVEHNRIHTEEKPFACKACNKTFSYKTSLQNHIRSHCLAAKNMGLHLELLDRPRRARTPKKPTDEPKVYKCSKCIRTFKTAASKRRHEKCHGDKYPCSFCPTAFNTDVALTYHNHRYHILTFECSDCQMTFLTSEILEQHRNDNHRLQALSVPLMVDCNVLSSESEDPTSNWVHSLSMDPLSSPPLPVISFPTTIPTTVLKMEY